jgi:hypothetical protein
MGTFLGVIQIFLVMVMPRVPLQESSSIPEVQSHDRNKEERPSLEERVEEPLPRPEEPLETP